MQWDIRNCCLQIVRDTFSIMDTTGCGLIFSISYMDHRFNTIAKMYIRDIIGHYVTHSSVLFKFFGQYMSVISCLSSDILQQLSYMVLGWFIKQLGFNWYYVIDFVL